MKKDILANAIRLADKSKARPEKVVISKPKSTPSMKKHPSEILSEKANTRLTPAEMKRLRAAVGKMITISELLRGLLLDYLDKKDRKHGK